MLGDTPPPLVPDEDDDDEPDARHTTCQLLNHTHQLRLEQEYNPWLAGKPAKQYEGDEAWRNADRRTDPDQHDLRSPNVSDFIQAMRMSYREAVSTSNEQPVIDRAVKEEVTNNIMPCGRPVNYSELSSADKKEVLNSFLFMKDKWKSDGTFDK
jgi:hypothetical protein